MEIYMDYFRGKNYVEVFLDKGEEFENEKDF